MAADQRTPREIAEQLAQGRCTCADPGPLPRPCGHCQQVAAIETAIISVCTAQRAKDAEIAREKDLDVDLESCDVREVIAAAIEREGE